MAGLSDLFGNHGVIEQMLLWGTLAEYVRALGAPALTELAQDVNAKHPVTQIDPDTAADLAARGIITVSAAEAESALSGVDSGRFGHLLAAHTVRLAPADLAEAVLRSYMSSSDAEAQASPQGVDAGMLDTLVKLAGDSPGPQQLAQAVRRGLIPRTGSGPDSVSFNQGIAEGRLADKWADVLYGLSAAVLSAPDAAEAVIRSFMSQDDGEKTAAASGVDAATFQTMIHLAGDAPGPQQLAEALRRGIIPATGSGADSTSFTQGIAEGRLADKWAPVIQGLAQMWPTPTDALDASVKGVFSEADGKAMYEHLGGDPQFYDWLLYSVGDSPTPIEAAAMAARGIIPWDGTGPDVVSYAQAVRESHYRDKWADAYRDLEVAVPSPGVIVSLLSQHNITEDQAHQWLLENNMSADLAAAYVAEADYEATSDYRGLTVQTVTQMYIGHVISHDQAVQILSVLHVSQSAAELMLSYADLHYVMDSINQSVQRIATLFTGRKISAQTARDALNKLEVPSATIEDLISDWEIQAAANVKILSEAQIVDAWYYSVFTQDEAISYLGAVGYTPYDAWALLSVKNKAPLPNPPANTAAAPVGAVLPGVT